MQQFAAIFGSIKPTKSKTTNMILSQKCWRTLVRKVRSYIIEVVAREHVFDFTLNCSIVQYFIGIFNKILWHVTKLNIFIYVHARILFKNVETFSQLQLQ